MGNVGGVRQHLELVPGLSISETCAQRPDGCGGSSSWNMRREEDQLNRMFIKASVQLLEQTEMLHRLVFDDLVCHIFMLFFFSCQKYRCVETSVVRKQKCVILNAIIYS